MSNQPATISAMCELLQRLRVETHLQIEVRADTRFVSDLGLASLELIGLVFLCEQTFGVSLVDQPTLLAQLHTVGQAVDAIREQQRAAGDWPHALAGATSAAR